jgi:hypothetical protein
MDDDFSDEGEEVVTAQTLLGSVEKGYSIGRRG